MNKLIKQLADRATEYAYGYDDRHEPIWWQFYNERFAELIVRECVDACIRANEIRYLVPPTQEQVVLSCMREIEETFRN